MGDHSTASSSASSNSDQSKSSSSNDDSSSSSSSTTSSGECPYVHVDKDWCPGTRKLREITREVAEENDCPKYSKKISKQILKGMEGMLFFRTIKDDTDNDDSSESESSNSSSSDSDSSDSDSSDSDSSVDDSSEDDSSSDGEYGFGCFTEDDEIDVDDEDDVEEIPPKKLHEAIRPFYVGERFMLKNELHCRDVYFNHPNHPGTQAFVRASQAAVIKLGATRGFDKRVYKRMKRMLYDSEFFTESAPKFKEADKEVCYGIFRARYEFDRKMIKKVIAENRQSRPIPGTVCIKCSCCCENKDPEKTHCISNILGSVPKSMTIPVLGAICFFFVRLPLLLHLVNFQNHYYSSIRSRGSVHFLPIRR
mmetsp:Transcript_2541/g.5533  ORF Transcript_2541/g.5533 Transcript_2541/m.5533 type:complete len:365 (-) Transcript_2541:321-1415(-)